MSTTTPKPVTTPIPVQLSEPEFSAFILPHLSMPKRGPKCKLGYHRIFNSDFCVSLPRGPTTQGNRMKTMKAFEI